MIRQLEKCSVYTLICVINFMIIGNISFFLIINGWCFQKNCLVVNKPIQNRFPIVVFLNS